MKDASRALLRFQDAVDQLCVYFEEKDSAITEKFEEAMQSITRQETEVVGQISEIRKRGIKIQSQHENESMLFLNRLRLALTQAKKRMSKEERTQPKVLLSRFRTFFALDSLLQDYQPRRIKAIRFQRASPPTRLYSRPLRHKRETYAFEGFQEIPRDIISIRPHAAEKRCVQIPNDLLEGCQGMAVHPVNGNLYLVNATKNQILVLSPQFELMFLLHDTGPDWTMFAGLTSIAISNDGKLIAVGELYSSRIQILNEHHQYTHLIRLASNQVYANNGPAALCFDEQNNIYASLPRGKMVAKFSADGNLLNRFGMNEGIDAVGNCSAIIVNDQREILVCSLDKEVIQVYSDSGCFLRSIETKSILSQTSILCRSSSGGFALADASSDVVEFYSVESKLIHKLHVARPLGISFDQFGHGFVVVSGKERSILTF